MSNTVKNVLTSLVVTPIVLALLVVVYKIRDFVASRSQQEALVIVLVLVFFAVLVVVSEVRK